MREFVSNEEIVQEARRRLDQGSWDYLVSGSLEDEMVSAMALAGLTSLSKLTPKYVCKAEPVTTPHEMSAWVNMPVGRIQ
jgi:hypothetical protein